MRAWRTGRIGLVRYGTQAKAGDEPAGIIVDFTARPADVSPTAAAVGSLGDRYFVAAATWAATSAAKSSVRFSMPSPTT